MDFTNGIIRRCANCPNKDGTFVYGEVPPNCDTIIIGEQPGESENRTGRPFVGSSGQLLDQVLRIAGIDRATCYVTNAIKCYGNDEQKNECAKQECLNNLMAEFQAIKPKYLLILGSVAQSALDGRTVLDVRGFVREFAGAQCIATLHPAAVFRVPEYFDLLVHDVQKFKRLLSGQVKYKWPPMVVVDTQQKAIEAHAALLKASVISFDIETESVGLGVPILCVGMYDGRTSYVFDYTVEAVRPYIKSCLENPTSKKVGQNLSFDISQLRCQGISPTNIFFDTMVAHHLIRTYLPHELNTLTSIYTNYPKYDDEKDTYLLNKKTLFSAIPKEILHKYNACDTVVVYDMIPKLIDELQEYALSHLFFNISIPLIEVLVDLRLRGVRIDVPMARRVAKDLDEKIVRYEHDIREHGGVDFNPRSSKQLCKLLYETLRLPVYVRTKKNAPSTSKAALLQLKGKHPVVEALTELRTVSKVRDTFLSEEFFAKLDKDSRIHTDYKIIGTTVGRLSCLDSSSLICTTRGSVPIGQLVPGDSVYTRYGLNKVVNVFHGVKSVHKMIVKGREIFASADHSFLTNDRGFVKLHDLKSDDILVGSMRLFPNDDCHSLVSTAEAEILGYVQGDGHIRHGYKNQPDVVLFAAGVSDHPLMLYLTHQVTFVYNKELKWRRAQTCFEGRIMSVEVARHMQSLGVGEKSHEKVVPDWLRISPRDTVAAYLRGLFEADGFVSDPDINRSTSIMLASVSHPLISGVASLLDRFGIRSVISYHKGPHVASSRGIWRLSIVSSPSKSRYAQLIGFLSPRKQERLAACIKTVSKHDTQDCFHLPSQFTAQLQSVGSASVSRANVEAFNSAGLTKIGQAFDDFVKHDLYHVKIDSIDFTSHEVPVSDIEVDTVNEYMVNGLICHNSAGPNLQNIPRGPLVRNIFTVPEGFQFLESDYEQAELRVAAYLSKDPTMIELFDTGKDIHRMVASKMFHKPESEITSEERVLAKFVDFGINYGRGWLSIAEQYSKSEEEARNIHDSFIKQFPVMMSWFQEQINFAREHRYVVNPYGRRRWFPMYGQFMNEWEREARAFIPQSVVADTCSRAMIKLNTFLKGRFRSRLIMNLHDAIMLEVADEELNDVLYIVRTVMEEVVPGMDVPIPVDIKVTRCWKEEKKEAKKEDVVEPEEEEPEFEEQSL